MTTATTQRPLTKRQKIAKAGAAEIRAQAKPLEFRRVVSTDDGRFAHIVVSDCGPTQHARIGGAVTKCGLVLTYTNSVRYQDIPNHDHCPRCGPASEWEKVAGEVLAADEAREAKYRAEHDAQVRRDWKRFSEKSRELDELLAALGFTNKRTNTMTMSDGSVMAEVEAKGRTFCIRAGSLKK